MKKSFEKLQEKERKAILCEVIAKKTDNKLKKEHIETIVNKLDTSIEYTINFLTDSDEFAQKLIVYDTLFEYADTGDQGCKQKCEILLYSSLEKPKAGFRKLHTYTNSYKEEKIVEEPIKKKRPYNKRKKIKISEEEINF